VTDDLVFQNLKLFYQGLKNIFVVEDYRFEEQI